MSLDNEKEAVEHSDNKTSHSLQEQQKQKSNKTGTLDIPEVINTSVEKEHTNDRSLSDNGNTPLQRNDTSPMSQSKKKRNKDLV